MLTNDSRPVIAIMYDFDKTLCTKDMQEYSFIPQLGVSADEFWGDVEKFKRSENMDPILAYLYMMLRKASDMKVPLTRENFVSFGHDIRFYPGVEEWFERINEYGRRNGVIIEHYVISSGIKEIIEGTSINKYFKKVYACEFLYDETGNAVWPKLAVNYTNKTQYLFRINKGLLDVYDDKKLNAYIRNEDRRVPFRNMIYIGDGLTDVPCMKLVKLNGGQSIAVFKKREREAASQLLAEERVDFITEADYSQGGELDNIVRTVIAKMSVAESLARLHYKHKKSIEISE